MSEVNNPGKWEKRWHPLLKQWIIYAGHRNTRPWSYNKDETNKKTAHYDPKCYLCPGNSRVSGIVNPKYENLFVFDNDHPVVGLNAPEITDNNFHDGLYKKEKAEGIARVLCYHPRHDLTISSIPNDTVTMVFKKLKEQMAEFIENPAINYVFIFENKGEMVGVSNPHPHCQIYATDFVFDMVKKELETANEYRSEKNRNIFEDIIQAELKDKHRIIAENDEAIAFIPFFARYAYEIWVFPKKRHNTLVTMTDIELNCLGDIFQEVNRRYDMNYNISFPYVMSILQAPVDGGEYPDYHLHLLIQPPLRQPGLKKFLAGPEIGGGNFMADTIPEEMADQLRSINPGQYDPAVFFEV